MAIIRPLERSDLQEVSALVRCGLAGWSRDADLLTHTLLEDPWTPDPPRALVALDDAGRVIGSIGAQRRRLVFDGQALDAVAVSHLVVSANDRGGAAGALLVRRLLAGTQALTFTDSSTPEVARIWRLFGGQPDATRSTDYMVVIRPARWGRAIADAVVRRGGSVDRLVPVQAFPLHAVPARLRSRGHLKATSQLTAEPASPAELADFDLRLGRRVRLHVAHDREYLQAKFAQLESMDIGGRVVRCLVRRAGQSIGWFAYIARPQVSRVLAVSADAESADAVFEALLLDANERGTSVVSGRSAPHLAEALRRRSAVLGCVPPPLIHAPDAELRAVLASGASLLEEFELLDSEWW